MPLVAQTSDGRRIAMPFEESPKDLRGGSFTCPICKRRMVAKVGDIVTPHFAHHSAEGCGEGYETHPESPEHLAGKAAVARLIRSEMNNYMGLVPDFEVPLPEVRRIADVLCRTPSGWFIAHEVQLASITVEQLRARTLDYWRAGVDVIWWLGKNAKTPANIEWCRSVYGYVPWIDVNSKGELKLAVKVQNKWFQLPEEAKKISLISISGTSLTDLNIFDSLIGYSLLQTGVGRLFSVWRDRPLDKIYIKKGLCLTDRGAASVFASLHNHGTFCVEVADNSKKIFKIADPWAFDLWHWHKGPKGAWRAHFKTATQHLVRLRAETKSEEIIGYEALRLQYPDPFLSIERTSYEQPLERGMECKMAFGSHRELTGRVPIGPVFNSDSDSTGIQGEVAVWSTGYRGGDFGHGGRHRIRVRMEGGAFGIGIVESEGESLVFDLLAGGDYELEAIAHAQLVGLVGLLRGEPKLEVHLVNGLRKEATRESIVIVLERLLKALKDPRK